MVPDKSLCGGVEHYSVISDNMQDLKIQWDFNANAGDVSQVPILKTA